MNWVYFLLALFRLSFRPSVCVSAWNNSAATGWVFMKLDFSIFWRFVEKIPELLKCDESNRNFTFKYVYFVRKRHLIILK